MSWLLPRRAERTTEATPSQLALSGAGTGYGAVDPIDGDANYRSLTGAAGRREMPEFTREKLRASSTAAYRVNPMARAIIDTYVAFAVGDSGLTLQCSSDQVRPFAEQYWRDPRNDLANVQELLLRSHLLEGETLLEHMVGATTGVSRYSVIDVARIKRVDLWRGSPMHVERVHIGMADGQSTPLTVVGIDDVTGLRTGQVAYWRSFRTLATDVRGIPFLAPVIDWLDSYDQVLSNLVDRTALMRYFTWDVTVKGGQTDVDDFVNRRGGLHTPRSGSVEVHNESVEWKAQSPTTGSYEDSQTTKTILTSIAGGAGLAKTWLADPEDANRATSLTMAEPVRRRVASVQKVWLGYVTDMVRFAVDQGVAAGRIPRMVPVADAAGETRMVPAAETVTVTGPEIAAADAQVTAGVMTQLATALGAMVDKQILPIDAARWAAKKAWEDYAGIPYMAEFDGSQPSSADVAAEAEELLRRIAA